MEIRVRLYGILRDQMPPENLGRIVVDMPAGTTIAGLLEYLNVNGRFHVSVNDNLVEEWETELHNGDLIHCFPPSGGGL